MSDAPNILRGITVDEAYRLGQSDMRRRICKMWLGWATYSIGGMHRLARPGRKSYADVVVQIRARCRIETLSSAIEAAHVRRLSEQQGRK